LREHIARLYPGATIANPAFYPQLTAAARERLLGLAEAALDAGALDPARAEELFR
jgi:hypothetical protein